MIELAAGGESEADGAGVGLRRPWRVAGISVVLAGFGLMALPAAIGLLVLWGMVR